MGQPRIHSRASTPTGVTFGLPEHDSINGFGVTHNFPFGPHRRACDDRPCCSKLNAAGWDAGRGKTCTLWTNTCLQSSQHCLSGLRIRAVFANRALVRWAFLNPEPVTRAKESYSPGLRPACEITGPGRAQTPTCELRPAIPMATALRNTVTE